MDLEGYIELSKKSVKKVPIDGKDHYLNKKISVDVYKVMKNDSLEQIERINKVLMCLICNQDGELIFDLDNKDHLKIVSEMDMDIKTALMGAALSMMDGDDGSKKKSKVQA